jgi:cyclopropane fatty-acyl-phospholipid synthase-like methyltransferase
MANYADYTYNSKNGLKRFAHRKRFQYAIDLIPKENATRLLDFGCGDGLFLNQLNKMHRREIRLLGFEPFLHPIDDNVVPIVADWQDVIKETANDHLFNCITCFEVLEHFSPQKQIALIEQMCSVLCENGLLIVSVPIESGIPSLVKNIIRRRNNKKKRQLYSYKNIVHSFWGKSMDDYRQGGDYLEHLGFYLADLEKIFSRYFHILDKTYSPFQWLGKQVNSQVFYRLQKKERHYC